MSKRSVLLAPAALALLLSGCVSAEAQDYAPGYAPEYPPGYDAALGSGDLIQPGDLFGGQNVGSTQVFYEPLSRYGRWADTRFGYAFVPAVQAGWRPYVNGRWGDQRLWISNDPWGWATDHYGRWGFDEQIGWVWVPGTEWAPSWVAFREDNDVAGWAPIPPGVNYSISVGFGSGFGYNDYTSWYAPSWVWVPRPYLYQPGFGGALLPWRRGNDFWRSSHWNGSSGWNGRPGYGNWNRPGTGGYNPGWNRPGDNRPGNNRPGDRPPGNWQGRPGGDNWQGRPSGDNANRPPGNWQGRPGEINNRPGGNWQGRPQGDGENRPPLNWQGRPPVDDWQGRPPGDLANRPPPNWQGRPPGSNWQGRPPGEIVNRQPGNWQGRVPGDNGQGRPPGNWQGRLAGDNGQYRPPGDVANRPPPNWQGRPGTGNPGDNPGGGQPQVTPRPDGGWGARPSAPAMIGGAMAAGMRPPPAVRTETPRMEPPRMEQPRMEPPRVEPPRMEPPPRPERAQVPTSAYRSSERERELPH